MGSYRRRVPAPSIANFIVDGHCGSAHWWTVRQGTLVLSMQARFAIRVGRGLRKYVVGKMRILLFSGKGGVGKTSLSAVTGSRLAELGYRTLVMSVDPAH